MNRFVFKEDEKNQSENMWSGKMARYYISDKKGDISGKVFLKYILKQIQVVSYLAA